MGERVVLVGGLGIRSGVTALSKRGRVSKKQKLRRDKLDDGYHVAQRRIEVLVFVREEGRSFVLRERRICSVHGACGSRSKRDYLEQRTSQPATARVIRGGRSTPADETE